MYDGQFIQGFLLAVSGRNGESIDKSWILRVLKSNIQYDILVSEIKKEIKNDLQSSQQWDILDRCIRLKISATVEQ